MYDGFNVIFLSLFSSLISDSDGNVSIYEIQEEGKGSLKFVDRRQYIPLTVHKSQWLGNRNGCSLIKISLIYLLSLQVSSRQWHVQCNLSQ